MTGQASQENHVERTSRTFKYKNLFTNLMNNEENIPGEEKKESIRTSVEMNERNWSSFDFHGIWLNKNSSVELIFLACRPISMVLRLPKHFLCQSMAARFERASIRNGNYVVGRCYVECRSPIMRDTTKDTCLLKPLLFDFIHEKLTPYLFLLNY